MAVVNTVPVTVYKVNSGRITAGTERYISPSEAATAIAYTDPDDANIATVITKQPLDKAIPTKWYVGQASSVIQGLVNA